MSENTKDRQVEDRALRVVTWNIRKALGTDRKRDPERVLHIIAGMQADLVLLQEADFRLPPRPPVLAPTRIEATTGLRPAQFTHGRDSLGWHGNALLFGPRLSVETLRHHDLPGVEPRGCVEAVLTRGETRLRVLGVHLGLLRASRRVQLSAILELLEQDRDLPTLIAGDFNERSLNVGLGRLSRRFRILTGGPTWHARHPVFALDRIAVTKDFSERSAAALRNALTAVASDHLPLVADLTLGS